MNLESRLRLFWVVMLKFSACLMATVSKNEKASRIIPVLLVQFWFILAGKNVKTTEMFAGLCPTVLFWIWMSNVGVIEWCRSEGTLEIYRCDPYSFCIIKRLFYTNKLSCIRFF